MKKENVVAAINEICCNGYDNMWKQIDEQSTTINKQAKQIERLKEQLDIVTEQRNDIHIDKQVLQEQLNEANKVIKFAEHYDPFTTWSPATAYLERWGVK